MSTDNTQKFRDAFVAFFAPDMNTTATALVDAVLQQEYRYNVSQVLDASVNTLSTHTLDQATNTPQLVKTFKVVTGVYLNSNATTVSDNTNNATFQLVYNNGNGGSDTVIATANTATTAGGGSGNLTAGTAYSFAITAANSRVPVAQQIQVKVTKAGAGGLLLPMLSFELKTQPTA